MRNLVFLFIVSISLFANVDKDIKTNSKKLKDTENSISKNQRKIKSLEAQIEKETKDLNSYDKLIKDLNKDLKSYETKYSDLKDKFDEISTAQRTLYSTKERLEKKLIELFAQNFSLSIVKNSIELYSLEDIILSEIYTDVIDISQQEIKQLNADYIFIKKDLENYKLQMQELKTFILEREKKRKKIKRAKDKQHHIVSSLKKKHYKYQKRLKKDIATREEIAKLLDKLEIVKKESKKVVKPPKKEESKEKLKSNDQFADLEIRTIGSSYKRVKTKKYRGKKTIPPLNGFSIEKKFGTYYDKIYKIKLFNDSLVLKPYGNSVDVVSVLDGKIIYAQNNPSLGNVVIIEHNSGYHTVYAHLSQIASGLSIGKRVKQNYKIGKVNKTLSFQVTRSGAYIDPMQFIEIN
jgi:septal ring factor EnvC (AmiA/AmiB activator)